MGEYNCKSFKKKGVMVCDNGNKHNFESFVYMQTHNFIVKRRIFSRALHSKLIKQSKFIFIFMYTYVCMYIMLYNSIFNFI